MIEEPVPVIRFRNGVPGPIRHLCVDKNYAHALIPGVCVAPHVPISLRILPGTPSLLKPRMLIRLMVHHHLGNHANAPVVCCGEKSLEILELSLRRMNGSALLNVVAVITH